MVQVCNCEQPREGETERLLFVSPTASLATVFNVLLNIWGKIAKLKVLGGSYFGELGDFTAVKGVLAD